MLKALRNSVSSWVGIGILAIALGALVFTLFQPSGPGGTPTGTGSILATVADSSIAESEYVRMIDRAVTRERERSPKITTPDFIAAGGGTMVFDQMIAGKAIGQFGAANGMVISKRMIDGEIASIPALQVNGKFDDATFRRLLANQRISEAELRDGIESDLMRRQLLQPVALGTTVPRGMAEPFAALLLEVRRGLILPIPSAAMPDPGKPTDAQLKAFHARETAAYTLPERRAFRFAEIDTRALAEKARPTATEVRKYYDDNLADYGGVETRAVNQIVLRDEAAARAFIAEVRGGKAFAEAAGARGFSAQDINLGVHTRESLALAVNEALAASAFALKPGTLGEPVASEVGFHVVEVVRIIPPAARPFATVSGEIENRLAEEKLADLLADTVAQAEDKLAGGQSLADVARDLGIALQTSPALTADGRLFDENYTAERIEQPLLPMVFAADPAEGPQVVEIAANRFALLELGDVIAPELVPLEKIRADVEAAWKIRSLSDAAKATADAIAAAASKGQTLAQAVGDRRLPPAQPLSVRRLELTQMAQQGQQVPPPVIMLLNTPKGQARVIAAPGGQGWFVVQVNEVVPGNLAEAPQLIDAMRQSLLREAGDEMVETFVRAIERDVGVVKKPEALKAVNRRLTGAIVE